MTARLVCWLRGHRPALMWFERGDYRIQRLGCTRCRRRLSP